MFHAADQGPPDHVVLHGPVLLEINGRDADAAVLLQPGPESSRRGLLQWNVVVDAKQQQQRVPGNESLSNRTQLPHLRTQRLWSPLFSGKQQPNK